MNKIDRYIMGRMLTITALILLVLIFIFIAIDFSENSDDFTDRGATLAEIWGVYYINYIPEMIRLVSPVAIFSAALLLTGQMADRVEIVALKGAGVSLYRFLLPFIVVSTVAAAGISYLDAFVVPVSNAQRMDFERLYIHNASERIDKNRTYRQLNPQTILEVGYFDQHSQTGYSVYISEFEEDTLVQTYKFSKMVFVDSLNTWKLNGGEKKKYTLDGIQMTKISEMDSALQVYPRDLSRTTSDIYQLTYPQILDYLESIERSGAGSIEQPKVQFYSKVVYPFSMIVITIIGVCLASVRRKGGKGVYLAFGLGISFIYLAFIKLMEPLGTHGVISPFWSAATPHLFFAIVAVILTVKTRK